MAMLNSETTVTSVDVCMLDDVAASSGSKLVTVSRNEPSTLSSTRGQSRSNASSMVVAPALVARIPEAAPHQRQWLLTLPALQPSASVRLTPHWRSSAHVSCADEPHTVGQYFSTDIVTAISIVSVPGQGGKGFELPRGVKPQKRQGWPLPPALQP